MAFTLRRLPQAIIFSIALPVAGYAGTSGDLKNNSNFSGLYVGGGIGANSTTFSMNNQSSFGLTRIAPVTSTSQVSLDKNSRSLIGELELGYGYLMPNHLYFGVSGFLDFANRKSTHFLNVVKSADGAAIFQDLKSTSTALSNVSGGITVEPGFTLAPNTLLFGMIGWERVKEKMTADHFVSLQFNSQGNTVSSTQNNINGLKLGLGFLEQVTSSIAFGVRYVHTSFSKGDGLRTPVVNTTLAPFGIISGPFNYTIAPQNVDTQSVMVNLRYYWNGSDNQSKLSENNPQGLSGYYATGRLGTMIPNLSGENTTISNRYMDRGAVINQPLLTTSQPGQSDSPLVALGIGAGKVFENHAYLGIEGSLDWSKKNIDQTLSQGVRPTTVLIAGQPADMINHRLNLTLNDLEPAVDARIGVLLPYQFLPYLRVGAAFNKVNYGISDQLIYFNTNGTRQTVNLTASDNKGSRANLRIGGGIEYQYSENNSFSINYTHTNYGKFNITRTETTIDGAGNPVTLSDTSKIKLENNVLTIGYTHYFGK